MRSMRPFPAILAASIALAAAGRVGQAAQLRSGEMPDGTGHAIRLSGEIVPGDKSAFHALAETPEKALVLTTGPGGAVVMAMAIGSEIRARGWATLVPYRAVQRSQL